MARRTESPFVLITSRRRVGVFLAVQAAGGADFLGGVTVGGLTIGPDGADALKRGTKPADSCCDAFMDLNALLRRAVDLGASDIHLKLDQPPMLRRDGAISPLEECPPLNEQNLLAAVEAVTRVVPERLKQFHETGDLDIAYTADGLAALPRQRLPAARRDLVRVSRDPARRPEFRAARPAAGRPQARERAPRSDPRHGRDRLR